MYLNRLYNTPKKQCAYNVYGTLHKGSIHEKRCKFIAYWNGSEFVDKDGEDLTGINDSVEYWFDIDNVSDPE